MGPPHMLEQPFSPNVEERWAEISEFPDYNVSDRGNVMRLDRQKLITPTLNTRGHLMVGLMKDGLQAKRALTPLVANAFVPQPSIAAYSEAFDTPINLDGDRTNNYYANLTWRPRWFALRYVKQFSDVHATYDGKIEDVETGITYDNSMTAATYHGLLDYEIYISMLTNGYVWPTGQVFRTV